jgi:hypothetical protein
VPLSSFNSCTDWFRITLLEDNFEKYCNTLEVISKFLNKLKK